MITLPLADRVRGFVDDEIVPHAGAWERAESIPRKLLARVADLGLWAPFVPAEHGGAGLSWAEVGRVHEEVGRGCSSVRSLMTVHTMVVGTVLRWGTDEQRKSLLPALVRGETLGAFCLSEPDSGSAADAAGTKAVADGDGWRLTGVKTWITGGQIADLLLVFARTGEGMSAFLVPSDLAGVTVTPLTGISGTAASMLARIDLDDVRLGAEALIGAPGWAAATVMPGALDLGRFSVASGSVGLIRGCLDACADYTSRRTVRGAKLSELPLIRRKMSDMVVSHRAGGLLCAEAGRLKDAGDPGTVMASWVAKYYASTAATAATADAVQIHGGNGLTDAYPVARLHRDARVTEIIEGSTELQQLTIADRLREDGLEDYFLYPQINWNPKSNSVEAVAKALNFGVDALAFVDDQPFEREEVAHVLPEVLTVDAAELQEVLQTEDFQPRFVTDESRIRREMYRSAVKRDAIEQDYTGTSEDFLATLDMVFTIAPAQKADLQRAEELTVRTNQLNATGRTYSYSELDELRQSGDHLLLVAGLTDKYGSYGKIGLALIEKGSPAWHLRLMLMSCRVVSRGVGTVLLNHIMGLAKADGATLRADFVETGRNRVMFVTYAFAGFSEIARDGNQLVLESTVDSIQPVPPYLTLDIRE